MGFVVVFGKVFFVLGELSVCVGRVEGWEGVGIGRRV